MNSDKKLNNKKIPKWIYQTYPGTIHTPIPYDIHKNINFIKKMNPGWKYYLFRDDDIIKFIKKNYNFEKLKLYLKINEEYGPARADFFRYLLIYRYGGVYLDIKSATSKKLDDIIGDSEYVLQHWGNNVKPQSELFKNYYGEFQQWNIMSCPEHPFLESVLQNIVTNIKNYKYNNVNVGKKGVLYLTGPILYTRTIIPLLHKHSHKIYFNNNSGGLIYNNLGISHKLYFNRHYTTLKSPIIL